MPPSESDPNPTEPISEIVLAISERLHEITAMAATRNPPPILGRESIHLHCTDVHGEWMLAVDETGALAVTHEHGKGTVAIRGRASDGLALLQGKFSLEGGADRFEVFGTATVWELLAEVLRT